MGMTPQPVVRRRPGRVWRKREVSFMDFDFNKIKEMGLEYAEKGKNAAKDLAEKGKTILVNTLEIPEIQKIADRCVVFYHGHIQTILPREEITEERVMLYATNVIHATEGEVNV